MVDVEPPRPFDERTLNVAGCPITNRSMELHNTSQPFFRGIFIK
jgi:hypothetical protein